MNLRALRQAWPPVLVTGLLVGLPLLGVLARGQPVRRYLEFPPLTRYVPHAAFAWPAFILLALAIAAALLPLVLHVWRHRAEVPAASPARRPFPAFGWFGLLLTAAAWVIAWTRIDVLQPLQTFTFSPLWLGYILVVNALSVRRSGHCMLRDRPRHFLLLFPMSAAFWWFFEYLNRFVQNWYYVGVDHLTPFQYAVFATLPFATVLPAVMGTEELIATFPRMTAGLTHTRALTIAPPRRAAAIGLTLAAAGLAGIGVWPDQCFPLLWLSPLIILTALQALRGKPTLFAPLRGGDWSRVCRLALAALVCGFFWEMWNVASAAKWIYAVPYVHRFQLFEMPLLGFAGYLPFGLECGVIADAAWAWLDRRSPPRPPRPQPHQENTP